MDERFAFHFFEALVTTGTAATMQRCMACARRSRLIVPLMHFDVTLFETLELEVWLMIRVPCRETLVTCRAMEQNHVG